MGRFDEAMSAAEPLGILATMPAPAGLGDCVIPAIGAASLVLARHGRRSCGSARVAGGRSASRARLGRAGRRH